MLIIVLSCIRCGVFKNNDERCLLISEENRIVGNDKDAELISSLSSNYFVPLIIEELLFNRRNVKSNITEPLSLKDSKFRAGYSIEGCRDTAWAKLKLAKHFLEKYNLTRIDSFIIRDYYRYSFVSDSIHLFTSHIDPNTITGMGSFRGNLSCRGCPVDGFVAQVVSRLDYYWRKENNREYYLSPDKDFDDMDLLLKDKFTFSYKYNQKKGIKFDELVPNLQRKYGIILSHEKTDTLKMGFYLYEDN